MSVGSSRAPAGATHDAAALACSRTDCSSGLFFLASSSRSARRTGEVAIATTTAIRKGSMENLLFCSVTCPRNARTRKKAHAYARATVIRRRERSDQERAALKEQRTAWARRAGPAHLRRWGSNGRRRPWRRRREEDELDVRGARGRVHLHCLARYRRTHQQIAAPASHRMGHCRVLVRAALVLATTRSAHNAIETAAKEHPARTGQAERCRNQDSCERTSHKSIFVNHSIPVGNCGPRLEERLSSVSTPTLLPPAALYPTKGRSSQPHSQDTRTQGLDSQDSRRRWSPEKWGRPRPVINWKNLLATS